VTFRWTHALPLAILAASCTSKPGPPPIADAEAELAAPFADAPGPGWEVFPWNLKTEVAEGGALGSRASLTLNADHAGRPWAIAYLRRARRTAGTDSGRPALGAEDLARGVLEFHANGGLDAQGIHRAPPGGLQVALWREPQIRAGPEVRPSAAHIDGAAWDADPETWQRVRIPLDRLASEPCPVFAVSFQLVGECPVAPRIDEVRILRLRERPAAPAPPPAASGGALFPVLADGKPSLVAPRDAEIEYAGGALRIEGKPVFLVGTTCLYDARGDLWGYPEGGKPVPPSESGRTWAGYPGDLAWIYEELLDRDKAARIGLNAFAIHVPPEPFWDELLAPEKPRHWWREPEETARTVERMRMPVLADFSGFTWGAGKAGTFGAALPPRAIAAGRVHMMPFSLLPEGQEVYARFFRTIAAYLHRLGIRVFQYELFNEAAYDGDPELHREDFAAWRKGRSGTGEAMEWRAYLADRFIDVVRRAKQEVRAAAPGPVHRFSVQLQSNDAVEGAPGIDPVRLADELDVIASPTDGGIWTFGSPAESRPARAIESPLAPAPLTPDLLVSLAGDRKPVIDPETYAPGRTGADLRRKLWRHVLTGFDGVYLYAWSKRAEEWRDAESGRKLADLAHWCLLNPYAHPPEELTGILHFRRELAPLAEDILPKPFGVAPLVAILHSHTTETAHATRPTPRAWGRTAYAAIRYLGYPIRVVSEPQLPAGAAHGIPAVVIGGASHVAPGVLDGLAEHARAGGIVVAVNSPLDRDGGDRPASAEGLLGIRWAEEEDRPAPGDLALDLPAPPDLPGPITGRRFRALEVGDATRILARDGQGRPCVTVRSLGKGKVYTVAFEAPDYRLAALLLAILEAEGIRRPWTLRFSDTGEFAPNVLVSLRDRGRRKVFLAANEDGYEKDLLLRFAPPAGARLAGGIPLRLPPREIAILVLEPDAGDR